MSKVGLALVTDKVNYGTVLQAYATQNYLNGKNIDNEVLDMKGFKASLRKKHLIFSLKRIFDRDYILTKWKMLFKVFLTIVNWNDLKIKSKKRNRKFRDFISSHFIFSPTFMTVDDLSNYSQKFDAVVVGSDQLWLPHHIYAGYYTLEWVPQGVKRISYATSFGVSVLPISLSDKLDDYINKLSSVSVRENSGADIIRENANREAALVCDPTLLLTAKQWRDISAKDRIIDEKYIFCYLLGNSKHSRKYAQRLRERTGYKIIAVTHMDEYISMDEEMADYCPFDVGPAEFLKLIDDAEYVVTDSFHATVFSLIFHKQFIVFNRFEKNNSMSTNSRIATLLSRFSLQSRLFVDTKDVEECINATIDFTVVDKNIQVYREESERFLLESIGECQIVNTVNGVDKYDCSGCGACEKTCPVKCVNMQSDDEGFRYPVVDNKACIECGKCIKNCPGIKRTQKGETYIQKAFLVQNIDDGIRAKSTSGGAFYAIAKYVIENGGYVFGAAFDEKLTVKHIGVNSLDKVRNFCGSKYVQSDTAAAYTEVKALLDKGVEVCYSGTPCQIEGLKQYLNKQYEKLLLVDVVCRGVPSPKAWNNYVDYFESSVKQKVNDAAFRDKQKYGYTYTQLRLTTDKKDYFLGGVDWNPYLRSFFENMNVRPSCFKCKYRSTKRNSDITLWDCLDIQKFSTKMDKLGTTRVLINSSVGERIFETIKAAYSYEEIDVELAVRNVKEMRENKIVNTLRGKFFEELSRQSDSCVYETLFKKSIKRRIYHVVRVVAAKTGIYGKVKELAYKTRLMK